MNTKGQLLLVSGLLMSITLIAVSSTITHSVNLGKHQGERHDLTPHLSSIEGDFPLALENRVKTSSEETLEFSFEITATTFESLFASKGYSLSFDYTSSSNINGNYTFVYSFEISDGYMNISLNQTASF